MTVRTALVSLSGARYTNFVGVCAPDAHRRGFLGHGSDGAFSQGWVFTIVRGRVSPVYLSAWVLGVLVVLGKGLEVLE